MSASYTKQRIIEYVMKTTEASSLNDVHVSKLIQTLGINRNTFYYHFDSKHDVAMYVFRVDLAKQLRTCVQPEHLLETPVSKKRKAESLPFYMHYEIGARPSVSEIRTGFFNLYRNAIEDDIRFTLGERYMPEETFDFLLHMHLNTIYETPLYHLANTQASDKLLDDSNNPFWNYPYETLAAEIQNHSIMRPRHR